MINYNTIIGQMKSKGIEFEDGLNKDEFEYIKNEYGVDFPPDLNKFLSTALPVTGKFINWRDRSKKNIENIKTIVNWPLEGILFDIEHNSFWYDSWGIKPKDLKKSLEICKFEFIKVPKLIPIYSHRYMPMEPKENNNPIFSIYQTDIIYYGENLQSYLEVEFDIKNSECIKFESIKKINFWSELAN